MSASSVLQQVMSGLTTAMFLFLIASGLSLVFGVMRVINFAHGSFYMLGAYLAWQGVEWFQPSGMAFWAAALFAGAGIAFLGGIVERLFFRYLYGRDELYQLLF
ncbi:MAG TPA: ABC transporter permease, partial [Stellaceae bacterium]|nr:ABC transporter permease [Stellaceae bacterium]